MPFRRPCVRQDARHLLLIPLLGALASCAEAPTTISSARTTPPSRPAFSEATIEDASCVFGPSFVPNADVGYISVCPYLGPDGGKTMLGTVALVELLQFGVWTNDGGGSAFPGTALWMGDVHFRQGATNVRLKVAAVHVLVDRDLRYLSQSSGGLDPDNDWFYFEGPGIYSIYPDITIEPSFYDLIHQVVKSKQPQKGRYIIRNRSAAMGDRA